MGTPVSDGRTHWERFFDRHAPNYLGNPFTRFTKEEVDFFLSLFPLRPPARILDVGCGVGRHSIELARRGYIVTGVDISEGMLDQARKAAREAGVSPEFVHADATTFQTSDQFDAAICLCEGAFNLIGFEDDPELHDQAILDNVGRSLAAGAPFVLTALNGYSIIRQMKDENVEKGSFDPATMIARYQDDWNLPEGPVSMEIRERLFIPPEITRMLRAAGFDVLATYGGTAGEWARRPLRLDEIEAMFVARKR